MQCEDRAKIVFPNDSEYRREKCWIARQANVSGEDAAGIGLPVDAVRQPIFGKVGVEQGIGRHLRKLDGKKSAQGQARHGEGKEEPAMPLQQCEHASL